MRSYNVVRFKVKPGQEDKFIEAHRLDPGFQGFRGGALVKTGDGSYCFIGEWESMDRLAAARQQMIGILDSFRDTLEDQGGGLGKTDPVSGEAVVIFEPSK